MYNLRKSQIRFNLLIQGGVHLRQLNYRDWRNFQYERPYGNNRGAEEISAEDDPCNGEDYCEDVDDYPHEAAMKVRTTLSERVMAKAYLRDQGTCHFWPHFYTLFLPFSKTDPDE